MNQAGFDEILSRLSHFAEQRTDLRAVVVVGSRARRDHPADAFSDLDLMLITGQPEFYAQDADWIRAMGDVWLTFLEPAAGGQIERRVLYAGGLDVDYVPVSTELVTQMLQHGIPQDIAEQLFRRGMLAVVDKDGIVPQILARLGPKPEPQPVTEAEFLNTVNDFWYHCPWSAKHLRRGELWWAKGGVDGRLKELLRRLLGWHAGATRPQTDTWLRGRFLEEWAEPRAVADLKTTFAHYDPEDTWRALFATMDLFQWLEAETAAALGFNRPLQGEQEAISLTRQLYEQRSAAG